jgi:hypothetical protein
MEIKSVWITTVLPSDRDPVGAVEVGYYKVENGILQMVTEAGKPAGKKYKLQPGDDPKTIAARLTKEAWMKRARESNFDRPLRYGPLGIA